MKRLRRGLIVFCFAVFLLLTVAPIAPAQQAGPFYVGAFGGFVVPDDLEVEGWGDVDVDESWAAGARFGYVIPQVPWLAVELEYTYLAKQDYDETVGYHGYDRIRADGDFRAHNLMGNLLFRYPQGRIHPYVGFGLGLSRATFELNGEVGSSGSVKIIDEDEIAVASQFVAGVNFEITPNWSADLGYKYFYSEYEVDDTDVEAYNHIVTMGVNYHF